MKFSNHTPGPWYFDGEKTVTSPNRGKKHQQICSVGIHGCRAAPDLLEALTRMVKLYDMVVAHDVETLMEMNNAPLMVMKAIRKAKGE